MKLKTMDSVSVENLEPMQKNLKRIADALSAFKPDDGWESMTHVPSAQPHPWRTRYDSSTGILIEEELESAGLFSIWKVTSVHITKDKTNAILKAAELTLDKSR